MKELTNFFKILSDETRLRIVVLLYFEELYVCQISKILELSQPKVSKHLTKLRDTGFVKCSKNEQFVSYSLNVENQMLFSFIKQIALDINNYPQLKKDVSRIQFKEEFFCNFSSKKDTK